MSYKANDQPHKVNTLRGIRITVQVLRLSKAETLKDLNFKAHKENRTSVYKAFIGKQY